MLPASGTPVITDGIAIIRGGPNPDEARRFYEFVTTPESLAYGAQILPASGAHRSRSGAVAGVDERAFYAPAAGLGAVAKKRKRLVKILGH